MTPVPCQVQADRCEVDGPSGTIVLQQEANESLRITTTGQGIEVTATLSREAAVNLLLTGANALGLILLDAKDAARRQAAARKRRH